MQSRFDLSQRRAAELESEYLAAVQEAATVSPPSRLTIVDLALEGTYPETELIATVRLAGMVRTLRFALWDGSFQEDDEHPEAPGYLASALVTQIFEEGAC